MKKTRKVKNKKIFLKWLKKSYKNKYSTKDGGAGAIEEETGSKIVNIKKTTDKASAESTTDMKKKAIALAAAVTLGDVAYRLASNPVVVSAVVGSGIATIGLAGVASCGGLVVAIVVGTCAYFKIKEAYSNYYTMINVMNDFILLLQKIDIVVRVAIKISQQYQFFIDTKDVNKCLERIFNKFNKLLTIEDIGKIQKEVESYDVSKNNFLQDAVNYVENEENKASIDNTGASETQEEQPKEIESKRSFLDKVKRLFKVLKLDSKKFTSQLNEEVTRLGLYFSILLGEFNIILNVSQMNIIGYHDIKLLQDNNTSVKNSIDFKKLLISSIIYRTLQIHNIFSLCTPGGLISDASKQITCSEDKIKQYTSEIESERLQIRKILFGKSIQGNEPLFPLYKYQGDDSDKKSGLQKLRDIMRNFKIHIEGEKEARVFAKTLHDFNEDISKDFNEKYLHKKTSDSSPGSTKSDDTLRLGIDYIEDDKDTTPSSNVENTTSTTRT